MGKEEKVIYEYHSIRKMIYDDDYIFYDSGKIIHRWDKHETNPNVEDIITADEISDAKKIDILEKCPEEKKETIRKMLYPENE